MFWKNYSGADATAEILVMLLVSFLLGAALMYFYDKFLFDCVEDDDEYEIDSKKIENKKSQVEIREKKEIKELEEGKDVEDDLKIVEGIGPKIESILKSKGITTLSRLAEMPAEEVRKILLEVGGERYAFHDPTTWGDQAQLAAGGNFEELKEYQDFLTKGKIS